MQDVQVFWSTATVHLWLVVWHSPDYVLYFNQKQCNYRFVRSAFVQYCIINISDDARVQRKYADLYHFVQV